MPARKPAGLALLRAHAGGGEVGVSAGRGVHAGRREVRAGRGASGAPVHPQEQLQGWKGESPPARGSVARRQRRQQMTSKHPATGSH